ncbi:YIP1 family protein [Cereibacter sphaeroides]|uniref:YIP1 family protein n=1 Tax=Cereibacter sphaeroides TaxID=1063 RepID=UPI001F3F70C5|nr:YIP1 family protein [Cereibacter sphaeroides]MCE6951064.1 YIP1 family protein [Cereibacter sphaeroides]MCE6957840.1 YIP1 family protein [Cereibacter sphaeroides]MCE6969544.1 YIP1 family protein [Cereibacter sphaeroides]MCE6972698.1 YIP1 family protein [Cereibacter sphaeroides]
MAVTTDIVESYRHPRAVIRRYLDAGENEPRALAILMGACLLIFVSQWPMLARAAYLDPTQPLEARMSGALMGTVFLLPPICYALAAISHLVARLFGGRGSYFGARLALFLALLATSPLMLLNGLVGGFIGEGPGVLIVGFLVLGGFLAIWGLMLTEAER